MVDNRTEEGSDSWLGVSKQRLLRIHCLCHECLRTCQGTWPNPTSLSSVPTYSSALLSFPSLFFLSYVFDSATIRIPSAIRNSCSCTLSRIATIVLVSSFQLLFFLALRCYVFLAILRFSFLLSNPTFDCNFFSFFTSLYSVVLFSSFARFRIWFCNFLCLHLSSPPSSFISFHPLTFSVASFDSTWVYPFLDLSLLFFFLICLFRIFRIRFSARAFYVPRSFSRIIPVLLNLFLYFVLSPFFSPTTFFNFSLSLFLTASSSSIYFDRS